MADVSTLNIPDSLLPADGRFGCGPSKVRPEAVVALAAAGGTYLGTSHRQSTVKSQVGRLRSGLSEMFTLPDGWEIVLGNGGTTLLWDALTFGLITARSQHCSFGEFSSKFAEAATAAPHIGDPTIIGGDLGSVARPKTEDGIDLYALTHNETSTGAAVTPERPEASQGLVAVDATSAAGGLRWNPADVDVYYFAPQKCLASDGGLWIAACSPAAIDRINTIAATDRWIPAGLSLKVALDNSVKDQTYNTPGLATVLLAAEQVDWINEGGGLEFAASRCDKSAETLYGWAEASSYATPFVTDPDERSRVVATIDIDDAIDAGTVSQILRANGIVDTESYRKLGRNQLRIAMFPAIDPSDIEALTKCINFVVDQLS